MISKTIGFRGTLFSDTPICVDLLISGVVCEQTTGFDSWIQGLSSGMESRSALLTKPMRKPSGHL